MLGIFMSMKKIIKSIIIGNFWGNCYIENKNKGDRKTLLVKKYLNKSRQYFKNTNFLKKSEKRGKFIYQ